MRFSYSLHHHIIALYTAAQHTPPSVAMRSRRLSAPAGGRPESARARCTRGDSDPFETRTMCPETLCVGTRGPPGRSGRHARRAPRFRGDVRAPKWTNWRRLRARSRLRKRLATQNAWRAARVGICNRPVIRMVTTLPTEKSTIGRMVC